MTNIQQPPSARPPTKEVSFCIPIMNRMADLQSTLHRNLSDNASDADIVEFIIICFDHNDELRNWLTDNFSHELQSGYLRFYQHHDMYNWHFGKAKNAFKQYINGKIYSSLDGDNFTGYRAGKFLIETFRAFNYQCIFHQFQGDYGDGTCGRISLSREDYLTWGYDDTFLPRQWDELDALLSVLANNIGNRTFLCYPGHEKNIIKKSYPFRRFLKENDCLPAVKVVEVPQSFHLNVKGPDVAAHDPSYVSKNNDLRLSSQFNHLSSYIKNSRSARRTRGYVKELNVCQDELLTLVNEAVLVEWFFENMTKLEPNQAHEHVTIVYTSTSKVSNLDKLQTANPNTLFIVIGRNLAEHSYSSLNNVLVYRPIVGRSEMSHMFWINIAAKKHAKNKKLSVLVNGRCLKSNRNVVNRSDSRYLQYSFFDYSGERILRKNQWLDKVLSKLHVKSLAY